MKKDHIVSEYNCKKLFNTKKLQYKNHKWSNFSDKVQNEEIIMQIVKIQKIIFENTRVTQLKRKHLTGAIEIWKNTTFSPKRSDTTGMHRRRCCQNLVDFFKKTQIDFERVLCQNRYLSNRTLIVNTTTVKVVNRFRSNTLTLDCISTSYLCCWRDQRGKRLKMFFGISSALH